MKHLLGSQRRKVEKRLLSHGYGLDGECWVWSGDRLKSGYGRMWLNGKTRLVHQIAYELWVGPIEGDLLVRHKCDNPPCLNPAHLETGTNKDNYHDMKSRGRVRVPSGDDHYATKVLSDSFSDIAREYSSGNFSMRSLGSKYSVSAQTICNIIKREKIKHEK